MQEDKQDTATKYYGSNTITNIYVTIAPQITPVSIHITVNPGSPSPYTTPIPTISSPQSTIPITTNSPQTTLPFPFGFPNPTPGPKGK